MDVADVIEEILCQRHSKRNETKNIIKEKAIFCWKECYK